MSVFESNDTEILKILKTDDEEAIKLLYDKYWKILFIAAYNVLKDKESSEDIVQEVFVNIWKKRAELNINSSVKSYLYSAVIYRCYDYLRKTKKRIQVDLGEHLEQTKYYTNPETKLLYKELVAYIEAVIQELPEKCRAVYRLSREDGLTHKEIAEKLNISVRTVETHIFKATKVLKRAFGATAVLLFLLLHNYLF